MEGTEQIMRESISQTKEVLFFLPVMGRYCKILKR